MRKSPADRQRNTVAGRDNRDTRRGQEPNLRAMALIIATHSGWYDVFVVSVALGPVPSADTDLSTIVDKKDDATGQPEQSTDANNEKRGRVE